MNKQGPSFGRIAAMVVFALSCFGLLLFLWLAFGGPIPLKPKGYRFTAEFTEATQLATEADVRISGVPVGRVKTITPDKRSGRSIVGIEMDSRYAPVARDTKAVARQKTLLGETYIELTPGTPGSPALPEGGRLAASRVSPTVELDEIYRAFDDRTRRAFQVWMQSQAAALRGRGRDLNDALGNLGPFADDAARVVGVLERQSGALRQTVANTGVVFEALSERRGQLRGLIRSADRLFATTAANDRQLRDTFRVLPTFERESRSTLRRLAAFARTTDPLVTQLRPAARRLSPALRDVAGLAPDLQALFRDLGPLITASRAGFPAGARVLDRLRPLLGSVEPTTRQLVPMLAFIGEHRRELTAFLANAAASTQAAEIRDGRPLHYLRTTNPLNPENLAVYPRRVGTNRTNPYARPGAFDALRRRLHLESYETRQCDNGVPTIAPAAPGSGSIGPLADPTLLQRVIQFAFPRTARGTVPAPPCDQQGPFRFQGRTTLYPQVRARPPAPAAR